MRHEPWVYRPKKTVQYICMVGQNPGKSRFLTGKKAFIGNRTGDYIQLLLHRYNLYNVFLTNVCNDEIITEFKLEQGIAELRQWLSWNKPPVIVCFGRLAQGIVQVLVQELRGELLSWEPRLIMLPHPSHTLRFNVQKEKTLIENNFRSLRELQKKGGR